VLRFVEGYWQALKGMCTPAFQSLNLITVLNVGGMNDNVQQEAQRVDEDVPLATLDLLARVVA
jgi:hypothetical protein